MTTAPGPRQDAAGSGTALLDRLLAGPLPPAYALLHRPESGTPGTVDVLLGDVTHPRTLAGLPLPAQAAEPPAATAHRALLVVPYRQLTERGFAAPDDGAPLIAMNVTEQAAVPLADTLARLPDTPAALTGHRFDLSDEEYADVVRRVVTGEIGTGEGANFVIKRTLLADVGDDPARAALTVFRRLIALEPSAYWTFAIHADGRTFVGATPERHLSVHEGRAVMNPISGTYRYPAGGPTLDGLTAFLRDRKETDELYMVLDEELKMMSRICPAGGRVTGPALKEMARLAHTEYFIEGHTTRDIRDVLRETLFAPTVTGSPVESAARVIARHEPHGRGYYSGIAALVSDEPTGSRTLDSAILIRTADIADDGRLSLSVGATLVRHSSPEGEAAETRAKAAALLDALGADGTADTTAGAARTPATAAAAGARAAEPAGGTPPRTPGFADHPAIRDVLRDRNTGIADFWLAATAARPLTVPALEGMKVLVVDAEDTFTAMMVQQLEALGPTAEVRRFDEPYAVDGFDLVVMGPGPGDPRAAADPKIAALDTAVAGLLRDRTPFLAVCLSHQVLSLRLGLDLVRRDRPNQGVQRAIDLFGRREHVGYYNTFAAVSPADALDIPDVGRVRVSRDPATGQIDALRGPHFASYQFHAESVLTVEGPRLIGDALLGAIGR
ncbi:anthranilate synthase family protein [Streptomyces sp. NBC_01808]|uniref:anthranilate synthase family protein n=1 Tax=Streptomyces sp. NBC_01808 TaxID=2975947 RepID=UPI002DDC4EAE|nr:anthranilate synthase family protein [Streptomyces sp. NBC_01808]WSA41738.1 anthranilate synthase family protein [Streptomyces sp. NBC_01808]